MINKPSTGRRVQIYLPGDLLERWEATPRYERSAAVAAALRKHWGLVDKVVESRSQSLNAKDTQGESQD